MSNYNTNNNNNNNTNNNISDNNDETIAAINPQNDLKDGSQKRLCWVCFGTEQDDCENSPNVWICPCQCKGTMKWVHEECLQRWIDEKQKRTNSSRVSCSHCKTHYVVSFPAVNSLVRILEHYDKLLYGSSPFVAVTVVIGSIYWCCGSYGLISIIQVMGYEEGHNLVNECDPLLLVIGLPVIPISLILAKLIKWEDFILKIWSRNSIKIPRPFSYLIKEAPQQPRANCDQILLDPGFNEPLGCTRMICGALLLPTVSSIIGRLFFSNLTDSQWRRSLMGGLAFLLLKGALKIYLRKSQYIRHSQRTIENYSPNNKSHNNRSTMGRGESSRNENGEPGSSGADLDGHLHDLALIDDSDDDTNPQPTRSRTMFSMTIRL